MAKERLQNDADTARIVKEILDELAAKGDGVVDRQEFWQALENRGINQKTRKAIQALFRHVPNVPVPSKQKSPVHPPASRQTPVSATVTATQPTVAVPTPAVPQIPPPQVSQSRPTAAPPPQSYPKESDQNPYLAEEDRSKGTDANPYIATEISERRTAKQPASSWADAWRAVMSPGSNSRMTGSGDGNSGSGFADAVREFREAIREVRQMMQQMGNSQGNTGYRPPGSATIIPKQSGKSLRGNRDSQSVPMLRSGQGLGLLAQLFRSIS